MVNKYTNFFISNKTYDLKPLFQGVLDPLTIEIKGLEIGLLIFIKNHTPNSANLIYIITNSLIIWI